MRKIAFIAFTRRGCDLALKLASTRANAAEAPGMYEVLAVSGPARFADACGVEPYESLETWTAKHFPICDALVFVSATGIAVRAIAPHVRDKFSDPAVVSIDERGQFAVPLLSGHVGAANDLARHLASITGGQAVISTATDVNGLFAVDEWAARHGFAIAERELAKEISARLLEGGSVGSEIDSAFAGMASGDELPDSVKDSSADLGFVVSLDESCAPFARTLHLVPRVAVLGVGCRKGVDSTILQHAADAALLEAGVPARAVGLVASIDVKRDESAIHELARYYGCDLLFYSAEELREVPGVFAESEFVERTVGVGNVCERAALASGGRLLTGKRAGDGMTVAVALRSELG